MNDSEKTKEVLEEVYQAYEAITTGIAAFADATDNLPKKYAELARIARQIDQLPFDFEHAFHALTGY